MVVAVYDGFPTVGHLFFMDNSVSPIVSIEVPFGTLQKAIDKERVKIYKT